MKKTVKVMLILLLTIALITISTSIFAATTFDPDDVNIDTTNTGNVQTIGNRIVGVIQVVGTIAAVGILIVLGIKYMMGSAEEKAEYKKTLFPYIIGAVLIFAASNIAGIVYNWAQTI